MGLSQLDSTPILFYIISTFFQERCKKLIDLRVCNTTGDRTQKLQKWVFHGATIKNYRYCHVHCFYSDQIAHQEEYIKNTHNFLIGQIEGDE